MPMTLWPAASSALRVAAPMPVAQPLMTVVGVVFLEVEDMVVESPD